MSIYPYTCWNGTIWQPQYVCPWAQFRGHHHQPPPQVQAPQIQAPQVQAPRRFRISHQVYYKSWKSRKHIEMQAQTWLISLYSHSQMWNTKPPSSCCPCKNNITICIAPTNHIITKKSMRAWQQEDTKSPQKIFEKNGQHAGNIKAG